MASGGHLLAQQRPSVEARIKSLLNADLKEICKAYGAAVSGTKVVLQKRCIQVLEDLVSRGDAQGFETFRYRVVNHGNPPPSQPGQLANGSSGVAHRNPAMAPSRNPGSGAPPARLTFKSSPFYHEVETVLNPVELPEMPQNRHTVRAEIKLTEIQARQLKDDENMRLLVYCGANTGLTTYTAIDIAFPNQIEVKVNNEDVKSNFKGLKNSPGTTKPADITQLVRKLAGYANQISICYALTQKRFTFIVRLVKRQSADDLAERIRKARVIPKQQVIDEMNKANADPDIAATSSKMSLKDPVAITRITVPVRSTVCQHNQCFDGRVFMQLQEQAPTWQCPICTKTISFESLCVDKYFEEILNATSKSIEQVTIEPNGQWSVEQADEDKGKSNQAKGEARAAWDDDFDDDVVEVQDSPKAQTNGLKQEYLTISPMGPPGFSFNTPPLSSREASVARSNASTHRPASNKRAASAVIDLTLDDDDEEQPPRPAKRQTTGNPLGGPTSSYNTPTSLPEPIRTQAYLPQPVEDVSRSTTYRPFSAGHPMRPPTTQSSFAGSQSPSRASPFTNFHPPTQQYASVRPGSQSPALTNGYGPFNPSIRPPSQGFAASQSPVNQQSPGLPGLSTTQQQFSGSPFTSAFPPILSESQQQQHQQQQQQHELFDFGRSQREQGNWRTNYGQPYPDPK